ncbi:hypothetical protein [Streptomyces virginiae]|uniref:hypothetical protein n=1 Tax=Streptomyces virginiae TaxID=1961 RepID=UPI0022595927|nr:hypothetical protein [Streptomyces virginiae]MCX4958527.1 hypothetical protein [Streptomyces virginiae]
MRTALRASIATAVLAGALLAPIAGTAYAATTTAPAAAAVAGTVPDRYAGTPVLIGTGVVAVLRNKSEGPEVWIRAVSDGWKPGDGYTGRVLATLDVKHLTASVNGLELELVGKDSPHPSLSVAKGGTTKSYPLPQAAAGPADCVSKVKQVDLGAGLLVDLTMSPKGPKAHMHSADPSSTWSQTLTRTNPKGSEAYFSRINNPSGAKPVFEWKTQGGENVPSGFETFPALPKGCTPEYPVTEETPAPKPEPSATKPVTATNVSAQTTGQTTVVPQGSVAAGAEIASASEDTDNSITLAAGAGLLSVFAALGATVLRRRRSHS